MCSLWVAEEWQSKKDGGGDISAKGQRKPEGCGLWKKTCHASGDWRSYESHQKKWFEEMETLVKENQVISGCHDQETDEGRHHNLGCKRGHRKGRTPSERHFETMRPVTEKWPKLTKNSMWLLSRTPRMLNRVLWPWSNRGTRDCSTT